jgi:protease PrsW
MLMTEHIPAAMVAAAIAPSLLLLWLVVAADSRPEPPSLVVTAFGLGVLCVVVALGVELTLKSIIPVAHNPWLAADQTGLLIAAIPEETLKISVIAAIALRVRAFDEPMDGVVYGAAVGLGFAALENLLYLMSHKDWGSVAVMRGLSSVPFHGSLGAIAGIYLARARFSGELGWPRRGRWHRPRLILMAWLIPVGLHAVFDAALFSLPNVNVNTPDGAGLTATILKVAAIAGFGPMIFATLLARRLAHRQAAWLISKRLPASHWRRIWAECVIGVGTSLVALPLIIAGNSMTRFAGGACLAIAVGVSWKCGRSLRDAAQQRHMLGTVRSP